MAKIRRTKKKRAREAKRKKGVKASKTGTLP